MRKDDLIIVKAKITMKTTEEGGRQSGLKSGYQPNHVFKLPDDIKNLKTLLVTCNLRIKIEPGETQVETVRFLKMPQSLPKLL